MTKWTAILLIFASVALGAQKAVPTGSFVLNQAQPVVSTSVSFTVVTSDIPKNHYTGIHIECWQDGTVVASYSLPTGFAFPLNFDGEAECHADLYHAKTPGGRIGAIDFGYVPPADQVLDALDFVVGA